jgi:putative hydrolase of HD superfamily
MYAHSEIEMTAGAVVEMARLALEFGKIDRTGPQHPDGTPESDTDHTVMLAWIAPSLADLINKRVGYQRHNTMRVAAYAGVHDAVEVYAGDTPTVRITAAELDAKAEREAEASRRLQVQFRYRLPWFATMVRSYEAQQDVDAKLVRSVDKLIVKAVHVVCRGQDLFRSGFTKEDFAEVVTRQRDQIIAWGNDELVRRVYDELTGLVHDLMEETVGRPHVIEVWNGKSVLAHDDCRDDCPFEVAYQEFLRYSEGQTLREGIYAVGLEQGQIVFNGKQGE